jgi:hypothetical protein
MNKYSKDNSLFMTVDGEIQEQEMEVGKRATQGKVLPSFSNSGALCEEVKNIFGGRSTPRCLRN